MSFLRLGVQTVVIDDEGRVLLSKRGDLNIWNLPGGRVDVGERLADGAAREVFEETGIRVHIERAVGLYYLAGWDRLNILYTAWPVTGELQKKTAETRDNRFFDSNDLPNMLWNITVLDALAETRHKPRIIETPTEELRHVKNQLRWRWVKNLVSGRPEPRFPRFEVEAVGVVWDDSHQRVLTYPDGLGRVLPRVVCRGSVAPWEQLSASVQEDTGLIVPFRWVGLWQDTSLNKLEFVFSATVEEIEPEGTAEWSMTHNAAFSGRDGAYLEQVKPSYHRDPVWSMSESESSRKNEYVDILKR